MMFLKVNKICLLKKKKLILICDLTMLKIWWVKNKANNKKHVFIFPSPLKRTFDFDNMKKKSQLFQKLVKEEVVAFSTYYKIFCLL